MLIFSMTMSVDGFVMDRNGEINWTVPSADLFAFHLERVQQLGAHLCGRRLYQTMLPWETDPGMRSTPDQAAFADVWTALPKVVFSRTLPQVQGNARLATGSLAEEIEATLAGTEGNVEIGGANLAGQALGLGLVDELQLFRAPVVLGGGTPFFPLLPDKIELELRQTRTFGGQIVYEDYVRVRRS